MTSRSRVGWTACAAPSATAPNASTSFASFGSFPIAPQPLVGTIWRLRSRSSAADRFLALGAHFIEYKPRYLPGYGVDAVWMRSAATAIADQIGAARHRWGERVVVNNQIERIACSDGAGVDPLHTAPRMCRTSLLRLVISTHGCYTCTPYRGEPERRVGNILEQPLLAIVESSSRRDLIDRACDRVYAYHEQNEVLLGCEESAAAAASPVESPRPQDYFL